MERNTRQREAIRKAFEDAGRPLGPQEALRLATVHYPKLGIATVYRTIKALVDEKWLVAVDLPGDVTHYEVSGKEHHHHFQCQGCNKVFEIHGCMGGFQRLIPRGFVLTGHEVILYGKCVECAV